MRVPGEVEVVTELPRDPWTGSGDPIYAIVAEGAMLSDALDSTREHGGAGLVEMLATMGRDDLVVLAFFVTLDR